MTARSSFVILAMKNLTVWLLPKAERRVLITWPRGPSSPRPGNFAPTITTFASGVSTRRSFENGLLPAMSIKRS